ncbi:hypothetical protein GGS23DRAFT_304304 [Durotheca rogersii]|uniref:uncharacterized protein n=1 Tax=Durotheca rogersii TaxID=419775 RepID=UPI00221EE0BF|nr:uncharacterized protein GGS23DRAFT_304304 [Durotheca rogersii]KAI5867070.1 hypothetical protein GGS23DRAFT_304304 [Durotheca rogersii]
MPDIRLLFLRRGSGGASLGGTTGYADTPTRRKQRRGGETRQGKEKRKRKLPRWSWELRRAIRPPGGLLASATTIARRAKLLSPALFLLNNFTARFLACSTLQQGESGRLPPSRRLCPPSRGQLAQTYLPTHSSPNPTTPTLLSRSPILLLLLLLLLWTSASMRETPDAMRGGRRQTIRGQVLEPRRVSRCAGTARPFLWRGIPLRARQCCSPGREYGCCERRRDWEKERPGPECQ